MGRRKKTREDKSQSGRLRIGDQWNAITIIALSQTNPLKAVAEFVENAIDANAKNVTIVRGKQRGSTYLKIRDDGDGIPRDQDDLPDFHYVATHICDSLKRRLKDEGAKGIQGEFGIGLLSFWTVGENLSVCSGGGDGRTYEMTMSKGNPGYEVRRRRLLLEERGTELTVYPVLQGLRQLTGERIQRYLASELRDRIRASEVKVRVIDKQARGAEYLVEPRQFTGQFLHDLPSPGATDGDVYVELYQADSDSPGAVGLYRNGTRILPAITELDEFQHAPWTSGRLEGVVDATALSVTPGSRLGVLRDAAFVAFKRSLLPVESKLIEILEEQKRAEEEETSLRILNSVQRALKEAFLRLPPEDYEWFDVRTQSKRDIPSETSSATGSNGEQTGLATSPDLDVPQDDPGAQPSFFEYAGPLHSTVISPKSCIVEVGTTRTLRAVCRDRSRRSVVDNLTFEWHVPPGLGSLDDASSEQVVYTASSVPSLVEIGLTVRQSDTVCEADGIVTVTEHLVEDCRPANSGRKGLPSYTFNSAPGENWRYNADDNVITINSGHRDYVYATKQTSRKMRYICRLFGKELVLHNFPGIEADELLERMVELLNYTEEHLR